MPIPTAPGALPEAHRKHCMRVIQAFARGQRGFETGFLLVNSKKCVYCSAHKEKCPPVPAHVREEYLRFVDFLEATEGKGLTADEQKIAYKALQDAATELSQAVQVARAQVSDMLPVSVMLAIEAQNRQVIEKLEDLSAHMVRINKFLEALVKNSVAPVRETRSKSRKAA